MNGEFNSWLSRHDPDNEAARQRASRYRNEMLTIHEAPVKATWHDQTLLQVVRDGWVQSIMLLAGFAANFFRSLPHRLLWLSSAAFAFGVLFWFGKLIGGR